MKLQHPAKIPAWLALLITGKPSKAAARDQEDKAQVRDSPLHPKATRVEALPATRLSVPFHAAAAEIVALAIVAFVECKTKNRKPSVELQAPETSRLTETCYETRYITIATVPKQAVKLAASESNQDRVTALHELT